MDEKTKKEEVLKASAYHLKQKKLLKARSVNKKIKSKAEIEAIES